MLLHCFDKLWQVSFTPEADECYAVSRRSNLCMPSMSLSLAKVTQDHASYYCMSAAMCKLMGF